MKNYIFYVKRRFFNLIAVVLLSFMCSYGQENYINGFIVNIQNDTLYGLLKNNSSFVSSQVCVFREDIKSRAKKLFPSDLKMYKENEGRLIYSKIIKISDKSEKVFLELLLDGIVDLNYYRDLTMNEYYFVDKGDGILDLLKNEKYTNTRDGIMYEKYTREFEKVLNKTFEKSDTIKARVKKLEIERESLISISKDYHKEVCPNNECIVFQKIKKDNSVAFGLFASYSLLKFQKIKTVSSYNYFMEGSDFGYISVPGIGIFL